MKCGENKTRFFHVLYQSERAPGPIYVINSDKTWAFDQSELAQGTIYIIIKKKKHGADDNVKYSQCSLLTNAHVIFSCQ